MGPGCQRQGDGGWHGMESAGGVKGTQGAGSFSSFVSFILSFSFFVFLFP